MHTGLFIFMYLPSIVVIGVNYVCFCVCVLTFLKTTSLCCLYITKKMQLGKLTYFKTINEAVAGEIVHG